MRRIDVLSGFVFSVWAFSTVGASTSWLEQVKTNLERAEYHFAPGQDGVLSAPNRANGFRTQASPGGIEVTSRNAGVDGAGPGWRLALSAARWGRPGNLEALQPGSVRHEASRIAIERGALTETYINDSVGLEQVFDVPVPPYGPREAGPLVIEMRLSGDVLGSSDADGASVLFKDAAGKPVGRLGELHVLDSGRREVPARFRLSPGRLVIQIDDRDAVYPLQVDPLLTSPSWNQESNQANAFFGLAVSPAGDVNGDGFSDVLIGAYTYDAGQTNEGRAFLYLGSASGLSTTAAKTFESNQAEARFGWALSTAGDLNEDGFDDFAVGAERYDGGQTDEGAVFVYTGAANAASIMLAKTLEADQADARLGYSLAFAGDVDGDGDSELVVGAPNWDGGLSNEGAVFVYLGDPATVIAAGAPFRVESNQAGANLGIGVAGGVDVNADGFSDVFAGAYQWDSATTTDVGRVLGFYGSATGLSTTPSWTEDGFGGGFGETLAAVGDTNGDGYADLAIGGSFYTNTFTTEGRVSIYHGSSTGLGASPVRNLYGGANGAQLGNSLAPAGDVNGDGYADIAVGANGADPGGVSNAGEIRVWQGSATGIPSAASWTYAGDQANSGVGEAVFTAGDVNGDGYSDLIVGAGGYDNGQTDEGRAYLFLGSGDGPVTAPSMTLQGADTSLAENFGYSVASAGDVNADGFGDIIVGDPQYTGGNYGGAFVFLGSATGPATTPAITLLGTQFQAAFGDAVASAGDVNGDGYDDVIVGAPFFDTVTSPDDENGKVYVFHGSASGVDSTADFTAVGTAAYDQNLGFAVAGVGDINGDGFADIAVAGNIGDATWVYYGSSSGIQQSGMDYLDGERVEAAGDVNGDGFSDVLTNYEPAVISTPTARVYYGGANGLGNGASWSRSANFNSSVHPAGDVNGDGFADVVYHSFGPSGSADELYLGGASGLGASADQTLAFGANAARTAGDVNGDGFADLLVDTGGDTMSIRFGSASGYGATASWSVTSPSPGDQFGVSFASAGDVNGDGFSDVIVGAPDGQIGGNARVYFGGGGDGLDFIPRNYRGDNTGPVAFLGSSGSSDRFRILARGRSARGRAFVSMDHQVAPLGTPIASGTFLHGNFFDTGATDSSGADVNFGRLVSGLLPETNYTWRMRFATTDPIFPGTRWISLPGNGPNEKDLKTACVLGTWYRDADGDGFGNTAVSQTVCAQPAGYVAASGDCNDADASMFPGNPEVCDGKDNNCNGSIDDGFAAPAGRPSLAAVKSGATATFNWNATAGADRYDAVRGGLTALRASGGNFANTDLCVANDAASTTAGDAATPPVADGFWYLVRAVNCTAAGTYDEGVISQQGSRDAEVAAAAAACP